MLKVLPTSFNDAVDRTTEENWLWKSKQSGSLELDQSNDEIMFTTQVKTMQTDEADGDNNNVISVPVDRP